MGGCASSSASVDAVFTKTPDGRWAPKDSAKAKQLKLNSAKQWSGQQPVQPARTSRLQSPRAYSSNHHHNNSTANMASSKTVQNAESTEGSWDSHTFTVMTVPLLMNDADYTTAEATASARKQRMASYLRKAPDCSFYTSTKAPPPDYIVDSEETVSSPEPMGNLETKRICWDATRAPDCSFFSSKKAAPPAYISDSVREAPSSDRINDVKSTRCSNPRNCTIHQHFWFDGACTWTYDGGSSARLAQGRKAGKTN